MSRYTIRYERDEQGWWVASVLEVPGCHTQGRSIEQTRQRIREALSLFAKNADRAELIDDVKLPATLRKLLDRQRVAREQLEEARRNAIETTRSAIHTLSDEEHMSRRDVGYLLDLSHQRIHQVMEARAPYGAKFTRTKKRR